LEQLSLCLYLHYPLLRDNSINLTIILPFLFQVKLGYIILWSKCVTSHIPLDSIKQNLNVKKFTSVLLEIEKGYSSLFYAISL
jgi:4-hydroxy-L-threonine phosphate dehydrogenase PdxA